ncbi:right-handed parallel beta-helix repeat-containing protein [Hymenobacter sp. BT175]|uniref:right-handed parallel beta-helix repeat-containing protein n=1 Tax=Hymenobacter translucens TaxID=2886507 RepID=UPI001D0EE8DA|nr:right-handed parallel beta-helix repeat-containing protein [Hymenobacter translucens]MCC2547941.1 right-handed parallel beta-helix repeat-containing protein [Hymenobacter translucens]
MKHILLSAAAVFAATVSGPLSLVAQAQAPAAVYVNDNSLAGDIYTTAIGNDDTGNGTSSAPYATVAKAMQLAVAGTSTIFIDAGTYNERMVLDKNVNLQGAGTATDSPGSATIFDAQLTPGTQGNEIGLLISALGGPSPASPLRITRLTFRAYDFGIQTDALYNRSNFLLEDIETVDNRQMGILWNAIGSQSPPPSVSANITFRRVRASRNALDPNTRDNGAGRGLFVVNGSKVNFTIEQSVFEQNRRAGIDFNDGSASGVIIRNCRFFQNIGPAIALLGAGALRDSGGNPTTIAALLENNVISDNADNGMELKACTGNGQSSGLGSFVVRGNYIARAVGTPQNIVADNAGIAFIDRDRNVTGPQPTGGVNGDLVTGGAYIENNTVRGYLADATRTLAGLNGFGIVLEGANNTAMGNTISRCQRGIQVQERPTGTTAQFGSAFFDLDRNVLVPTTNTIVRYNRLDSCTTALRAVNLTSTVDASLNWFGSNDPVAVRGASGTGGLVQTLDGPSSFTEQSSFTPTGRFDYTPFLNSNTDGAPATAGFQGDLSYLNADFPSPQTGTLGRLREGVTLVTENGTLRAAANFFNEEATFDKTLTLTNTGATTIRDVTMNGSGKVVTLGAPFSLSGALVLTDGKLSTTLSSLLTLNDGATSTSGNATSFVMGPLSKLGTQAFVFPLGKGNVWARLGVTAPASTATALTAEYFDAAYPNQTTAPDLVRVSSVEYWTLDRTGSTDLVGVQLYYENAGRSGVVLPADLRVARFNGAVWVNEGTPAGGVATGAGGTVASNTPTSGFGPFTLGTASEVNPLPVTLVSFRAIQRKPGVVSLEWITASEKNNRGYSVERSFDGTSWKALGFVNGKGTTSERSTYSFQDLPGTTSPTAYYRLQQTDLDGTTHLSPVATVNLTKVEGETQLALFPNPAQHELTVQLSAPATGNVQLLITDLTGRTVLSQTLNSRFETDLPVVLPASLRAGTYLVQVKGEGISSKAMRMVKQ